MDRTGFARSPARITPVERPAAVLGSGPVGTSSCCSVSVPVGPAPSFGPAPAATATAGALVSGSAVPGGTTPGVRGGNSSIAGQRAIGAIQSWIRTLGGRRVFPGKHCLPPEYRLWAAVLETAGAPARSRAKSLVEEVFPCGTGSRRLCVFYSTAYPGAIGVDPATVGFLSPGRRPRLMAAPAVRHWGGHRAESTADGEQERRRVSGIGPEFLCFRVTVVCAAVRSLCAASRTR